jgi:DNA-binding MarR family transcriptional regulator
LKVIQANPGISQARVAEVLYIETSRMVQKVDRLEARHLVERRRSDSDRRAHELHLTPAGGDLLAELMPLVEMQERAMAERIGQKAMADIVESLRAIVT